MTHGRLSADVTEMRDGNARGGIQALDAALQLLKAMATFDTPASLTDLARAAGMPASKAHRYLASFAHAGLVVQERRSGLYDLGPGAAQFGLAALARNEFVNRASDRLGDLTSETGLTALLVVWGNLGATVVRWQRAPTIFITSLGLGTTMPLLNSASGRVFLAFLPKHITAERLRQEVKRAGSDSIVMPDCDYTTKSIASLVARVRADGLAAIDGRFIPGLNAISAPILNWQEEAEASVTLIGTRRDIIDISGATAERLRDFVRSISIVRSNENR